MFQNLRVVLNEEDASLGGIVENFGKEGGVGGAAKADVDKNLRTRSAILHMMQRLLNYLYIGCHLQILKEWVSFLAMHWDGI